MFITVLKSKINNARITQTELYYNGSITIDADILKAAGIRPSEKVEVLNLNNGSRLETYTIAGQAGSGEVCLNGPAARQGCVGDCIIILSYALMTEDEAKNFRPKIVALDQKNRINKKE